MGNSLNVRQEVAIRELPRLGARAAKEVINEWGQPKSCITHIIFYTISDIDLPSADYQLAQILGLNPNIKRVILYQQGYFTGRTTLRLAKCLAQSRKGARVLVVYAETTTMLFRAPSEEHQDDLVTQALFADGASALLVGVDPDEASHERASFVIVSTSQVLLPDSMGAIGGHLSEGGLLGKLHRDVPQIVSKNVGKCLEEAFTPTWYLRLELYLLGAASKWPSHSRLGGGELRLKSEKLLVSRHVLAEHGNMASGTVHFALDEMHKRSAKEGKATTGEGLEWGVLFGFRLCITIETVILNSVPI